MLPRTVLIEFRHGLGDAVQLTSVLVHSGACWTSIVPAARSSAGGLLFCCLDTEEQFARHGRNIEQEDPTHVCIRPMAWWHRQPREAGWDVCTAEHDAPLREHAENFLKRYDWDWFVARAGSGCV